MSYTIDKMWKYKSVKHSDERNDGFFPLWKETFKYIALNFAVVKNVKLGKIEMLFNHDVQPGNKPRRFLTRGHGKASKLDRWKKDVIIFNYFLLETSQGLCNKKQRRYKEERWLAGEKWQAENTVIKRRVRGRE